MLSEIECGVCYRTFNAGHRCPRELQCGHSFCESCLRALARARPGGKLIHCPLCRHPTVLSGGEGGVRAELRVDECALERLVSAGVLEQEEEEEEEEAEERRVKGIQSAPEENDIFRGEERGMLRRCWWKVWRRISRGADERQREDCTTPEELRNLAMMSCYMF